VKKIEMSGAHGSCGKKGGACRVWCGILMESEHLDRVGVEGMTILKRILRISAGK